MRFIALFVILLFAACAPAQRARPAKRAAAKAPPKRVAQVATTEQLDGIERTFQVGLTALTSCYTDEMGRLGTKKFQGRILFNIVIGTDEKASEVLIGKDSLPGAEMHKCMTDVISGWEFPKIEKEMRFSRPIEFSPAY